MSPENLLCCLPSEAEERSEGDLGQSPLGFSVQQQDVNSLGREKDSHNPKF